VEEAAIKGPLTGHPLQGVKVVLTDGQAHVNDSSEMAFKIAMRDALKSAFGDAQPKILEPVMTVEVEVPADFQVRLAS
jgi:elongation factor G